MSPYTQDGLPWQAGSDTSHDAAVKASAFSGRQAANVYAFIRTSGSAGVTQREASDYLDIGRPSICARFRELEQAGRIVKTTARREGCACYVAVKV